MQQFTFLPVLITDEPNEILKGNIKMSPFVEEKKRMEIEQTVSEQYNGQLLDFADLYAIGFPMYPLIYKNGNYRRMDWRFAKEGDTAIIFTKPYEFFQRLSCGVQISFPNIRYLETANVCYEKAGSFKWCVEPKKNSWKKEIRVAARIQHNLAMQGAQAQTTVIPIGDISDIAIAIPVRQLIRGNFPEQVTKTEFRATLDGFIPKLEGIKGWNLFVMANVMEIQPTTKWINLFQQEIGNDWKANTSIERLMEDGNSTARLVFHHVNGMDKIHIGINFVEFSFADLGDRERDIVTSVMEIINSNIKTEYCRMAVMTNANLGTVTEKIANRNDLIREQKIKHHKGLVVTRSIETDYCISKNILGLDAAQRAWHFTIRTGTPDDELITYYSLEDVLSFFDEAGNYNRGQIETMKGTKVYARFNRL